MDKLIKNHRVILSVLGVLVFSLGSLTYLFSSLEDIEANTSWFSNLSSYHWEVVIQLRLPRMIMAICNGILLSMAGALTQALFKNPLAAPSLIGVSSGASLMAAATILATTGIGLPLLSDVSVPLAALIGGAVTCLLVFRLSWLGGRSNVAILILAGVAVNAICGAFLGMMIYAADDASLRSITFWTMGSVGAQNWNVVGINVAAAAICIAVSFKIAKALTAISLGESLARHAGYSVERYKIIAILTIAMSVGVSVSFCGLIGFVGLVVPHIARMLFGASTKQVLSGCLLLGPVLLLFADYVAKTVVFPAELPIGIVTSGIGGPFFVFLLIRFKKKGVEL